jgi:thiamine-monophosphate kinase
MSKAESFNSEHDFELWLRKRAPRQAPGLILGIGDDAALVKPRRGWASVLTSDLSIEGIHFTKALHPPAAVGHRALARSLSDIAAMGAIPRFALISLALSRPATRAWVTRFFAGISGLACRFGVAIAGGDTAAGVKQTVVDVTVIGETPPGEALLRSGARPGDLIFVAGELGLSALGLELLKKRTRPRSAVISRAICAHLYPQPQCVLGRYLARRGLASAAMDISDGLSTDLARLAEASQAGACVESDRIPLPENPTRNRLSADRLLSLAMNGGEDYRLLFTVPAARARSVPQRFRGIRIYQIGEMREARQGLTMIRKGIALPLRPAGYDHFR